MLGPIFWEVYPFPHFDVDEIECDVVEYVRQQYLDEEIILDANAAWLSLFFANFNSNCVHGGGDCHHGYNFSIRLHFIVGYYIDEMFYQNTWNHW